MALVNEKLVGRNAASSGRHGFAAHNPWLIFWAAFLVRVLYITLAHTYRIRLAQDHFQFGWEMGRVARALATGYGYADPFVGHTGPTAWVPPLFPLMLAGVFKLFGVYTALSAWVILVVDSFFSAATALFIYQIAARCYSRRVAVWSAWLWALYPAAMQYAVHWVWEMSLTSFLFTWTLALALKMRGIQPIEAGPEQTRQTTRQWLLFGLLWGLIALSNSTLLLFLPVCGIWLLLAAPFRPASLRNAALAALLFLAILAPWTVRNFRAFHTFVPLRDNLGPELEASSGPGSNGFPVIATLPLVAREPHTMLYKSLGEIRYVRLQGAMAKTFIAAHPGHYARITLKRFYFFWASVPHPVERSAATEFFRELSYCFLSITGVLGLLLSLKNRAPAAGLFAWAFLLLPLTYYFTTVNARFRHPLEPLIAIVSVYLFQSASRRKSARTVTA
ncbi:MAG TPA: glycosyltransferase family 39 protein [Silvibacterium sp.]|nr:glycosyltransferase family 39 protein [Silvibacterium sp.]